jgi:hypothetical protein
MGFRVPTSRRCDCGQRFDDIGVLVASSDGGVMDEDQCDEGISRVWSTCSICVLPWKGGMAGGGVGVGCFGLRRRTQNAAR